MSLPAETVPRDPPASEAVDGFSGLRTDTARAFLLAPGVAALAGGVVSLAVALGAPSTAVGPALVFAALGVVALAVVGYLTALLLALPVYLLLPERARRSFLVVVPMAGAVAAAPWSALGPSWRDVGADGFLLLPFALGCVGGVAFVLIRDGLVDRKARRGWRR